MKKYIFRTLLGLFIIAISAHYFIWDKASRELERFVHESIEQYKAEQPNLNITAEYTLKRTGYPLSAAISSDDYTITATQTQGDTIQATIIKGDLELYTELLNPFQINVILRDLTADITRTTADTAQNASLEVATIRGSMTPVDLEKRAYNLIVEDLDLYADHATAQMQRVLTINNIHLTGENAPVKAQSQGLHNLQQQATFEGLTFLNTETLESEKLESFSIKTSAQKLPINSTAWQTLQNIYIQQNAGIMPQTAELKQALHQLVQTMEQEQTQLNVEELTIKNEDLFVFISADMSINQGQELDLTVTAKVKNLQKTIESITGEEIPSQLTLPLAMTGAQDEDGNIMYNMTIKDGFFNFSGIPLFPVPSLTEIIDSIPTTIQSQ